MSIEIKQRDKKLRIELNDEFWEVESRVDLYSLLNELLNLKDKYGKINTQRN